MIVEKKEKKMPRKKKETEKKYVYNLIINCKECGTVSEEIGPCVKCGNMTFVRTYEAVEEK